MITLPAPYIATRYSGYFWNIETRSLFSIKISGELKELKRCYPSKWNNWQQSYSISLNGRRRYLTTKRLNQLRLENSVVREYGSERMLTEAELNDAVYDWIATAGVSNERYIKFRLDQDFKDQYNHDDIKRIVNKQANIYYGTN